MLHSWAEVWTQWTVWESVITNLQRINKLPTDPLTWDEYTYSRLNTKKEYELWAIIEWDLANNVVLNQANALDPVTAYVKWTYNWVVAKVSTWSTTYVLAVPTIITGDFWNNTLINILSKDALVFNWYDNVPAWYDNWSYTSTWWFTYDPSTNLVVYEWDISWLSKSWALLTSFADSLQLAYTWSEIWSSWIYADLLLMDITNTWSIQATAWAIVNNQFGWEVVVNSDPIIYEESNCIDNTTWLVWLWHLDWDALDSSWNNNNWIINWATSSWWKLSTSYNFDWNDDITVPNSSSLEFTDGTKLTIMTWIKPTWWQVWSNRIIEKYYGWSQFMSYILMWSNTAPHTMVDFWLGISTWWYSLLPTSTSFTIGEWSHVVWTYDGSTMKTYVDWEISSSGAISMTIPYNSNDLFFWKRWNPNSYYYNWNIDEVAIYNRPLSDTEISDIYNWWIAWKAICNP